MSKLQKSFSPIEIWHGDISSRESLKKYHILSENADGEILIPAYKCTISRQGKKPEVQIYPFQYFKMFFLLKYFKGDYKRILNTWDEHALSFLCGKDDSTIITLHEYDS